MTKSEGSRHMAASLEAGDTLALGFALRHDEVAVPLFYTDEHDEQFRVFPSRDPSGEKPFSFAMFSSPETLSLFLGADDERRAYKMVRADNLVNFLTTNRDSLMRVHFDPAGPHAMSANVDDVLRLLEPRLLDDDSEWSLTGSHVPPAAP